jgi:hypothetical protein
MSSFFFKKKCNYSVTFATSCYEVDWQKLLLNKESLDNMIGYNRFDFAKKMIIINNVKNLEGVLKAANKLLDEKTITDIIIANDEAKKILSFFNLKREDFKITDNAKHYHGVDNDWIYYNALAPLTAIYNCTTDYLLYMTADVRLKKPIKWIEKALVYLKKYPKCAVANLLWNNKKKEAEAESYKKDRNFFFSKGGFSDQQFLIKVSDFKKSIYQEIREDAKHFPRGEVFEKRIFSYLKNRELERITYRRGYYLHSDTKWDHSVTIH